MVFNQPCRSLSCDALIAANNSSRCVDLDWETRDVIDGKKIKDKFRASSSPTGMPNITPIRSEMKALQLFFRIFAWPPMGSIYI